jgi:hypothetical protein
MAHLLRGYHYTLQIPQRSCGQNPSPRFLTTAQAGVHAESSPVLRVLNRSQRGEIIDC